MNELYCQTFLETLKYNIWNIHFCGKCRISLKSICNIRAIYGAFLFDCFCISSCSLLRIVFRVNFHTTLVSTSFNFQTHQNDLNVLVIFWTTSIFFWNTCLFFINLYELLFKFGWISTICNNIVLFKLYIYIHCFKT